MENIKIEKISPILFEEQLRLREIMELIKGLLDIMLAMSNSQKNKVMELVKYTLSYNNVYDKKLPDILKAIGAESKFDIVIERKFLPPKCEILVSPEIYKIFYGSIWKKCIQQIIYAKLYDENLTLKISFKKDKIKIIYPDSSSPLKDFKSEIYELFRVNKIDIVIEDDGNEYIIEVDA